LIERDDRTISGNLNAVAKLAGFAVYLDAIVKELFKVCTIEDTVGCRLGVVNGESVLCDCGLPGRSLGLRLGEKGTV
jgi:hypothetical protein